MFLPFLYSEDRVFTDQLIFFSGFIVLHGLEEITVTIVVTYNFSCSVCILQL